MLSIVAARYARAKAGDPTSEGILEMLKNMLGGVMGKAERYLEHSEECLAFAKSITDPEWQTQLVAIAAQWREAAERERKIDNGAQQTMSAIRGFGHMKSRA